MAETALRPKIYDQVGVGRDLAVAADTDRALGIKIEDAIAA